MVMKKAIYLAFSAMFIVCCSNIQVHGQEVSLGDQVTKKMGMYVFPANGQDADLLNKDESDCYSWAVKQSGVDPLNPPQVEAAQVASGPDGSAIMGSAKGAAVGAAIGAISGHAGRGASYGAIGGALSGRRSSKANQSQQQAANNQAAAQAQASLMNSFKKAYSACLEGKGYTVQ
jgi:hypothetical protein